MVFRTGSNRIAIDSDGFRPPNYIVETETFDSSAFRSSMWDDTEEWWRGTPVDRYDDTLGSPPGGGWDNITSKCTVATSNGVIAVGDREYRHSNGTVQQGRVDLFETGDGKWFNSIDVTDANITLGSISNYNFGHAIDMNNGILAVAGNRYKGTQTANDTSRVHLFDVGGRHFKDVCSGQTDVSAYTWPNEHHGIRVGCGRVIATDYEWDSANATGDWVEEGRIHIWDINKEEHGKSTTEILVKGSDAYNIGMTYNNSQPNMSPRMQFGRSVAIGHGRIVVGAPGDIKGSTTTGDPGAGSAFILDLDGNFITKIVSPYIDTVEPVHKDGFGYKVAIGCGIIAVAEVYDDIGGTNTGSVHTYDLSGKYLETLNTVSQSKNSITAGSYYVAGQMLEIDNNRIIYGGYNNGFGFINVFGLDGDASEDYMIDNAATYRGAWWGRHETVALKNGIMATITAENINDSAELWIHKIPLTLSGKIDKQITKS